MSTELTDLFSTLGLPKAGGPDSLSAIPVPGSPTHRLAMDTSGAPCVLLAQPQNPRHPAPIRLQNLEVSYDVPCTILSPDGKIEHGTFTIIKCATANPRLFSHFLSVLSPVVAGLGATPSPASVRRAIAGLVELFQALTAPSRKTIQGLWAELAVIRRSRDPALMASVWHRGAAEHYDFVSGVQRIDVKSSGSRKREHHFSHAQLAPPLGTRVVIASLFAERAGGGVTVRQLFNDIRSLLSVRPEILIQFDATFYSTLGSSWDEAMDEAFDWELAVESLAFFDASSVPQIGDAIPPQVSEIHYKSDLSAVTPIASDVLSSQRGLFAAAVST